MTETQIQSGIIDYLSLLEAQGKLHFWRLNNIPPVQKDKQGGIQFRRLPKGSKKGIPDILVFKAGRTIALEVKTSSGRQSKEQKEIEANMTRQEAEYHVVRSIDEVMRIIKGE